MCKQGEIVRLFLNGDWRDVDMCISNIVAALNDGGATTIASCCGHGQRTGNISLADGRELIVARDYDEARLFDKVTPPLNATECTCSRGFIVGHGTIHADGCPAREWAESEGRR